MKPRKRPTVAEFITRAIKASGKPQKEIAAACGWPKPNFVSMLKSGDSRLPLDKVGPLATVLGVEPVYLFWLVMQEYAPETLQAIEFSIRGVMLNEHERNLIEAYRDLTHGLDEDVVLTVGGDEVKVRTDGSTIMIRHVPGKSTNVGMVHRIDSTASLS